MQLAWTHPLPAAASGMSLAREPGTVLVWDAEHHLARYDVRGQLLVRQRASSSLLMAACSDDGQSIATIGQRGKVRLMTAEFAPVFERTLEARPITLALDALGLRVAVADEKGGLHVFDRTGKRLWHTTTARPLVYLTFFPESASLFGCAEYGLVAAFDRAGKEQWRDGLVANVGGLAVSGDGKRVVLACFTEGLYRYSVVKSQREQLARAAPSRLVGLDYRGEVLLTTGLGKELVRRGLDGELRSILLLPANPVAVALEALGEAAVVLLASGALARVELVSS